MKRRRLSVIICIYDMQREAPRTILSATAPYQQDVRSDDYEVIVVDNGSNRPLSAQFRESLPPKVRFVEAPDPQPSPACAMNWAAREIATGEIVLLAIDGARIFSNGLYAQTLRAHAAFSDAFVYTLAWQLGPQKQRLSVGDGYDATVEDRLIADSGWPERPDALWEICALGGSSEPGFFHPITESSALSVPRELFERIGGYDERFALPGGGLVNLELFSRYVTRNDACNLCLLSEGTFHQVHGGVATSGRISWDAMAREYGEIFKREYGRPSYEHRDFGEIRPVARRFASVRV